MCYPTSSGNSEARKARQDEKKREQRIERGTASINDTFDAQFDDRFFKKRSKAYADYANPQLESQRGDAARELTYALARSGLTDSSARSDLESRLKKQYDLQQQDINDKAIAYANEARSNVEDARQNLITTLSATGDASAAARDAITRAGMLSQPTAYSPLTNLFADFTSALGTQAAAERSFAAGGARPSTGTWLFGGNGVVNR